MPGKLRSVKADVDAGRVANNGLETSYGTRCGLCRYLLGPIFEFGEYVSGFQMCENAACSRLSIVQFATGPKRSMGHVLGAGNFFFLIRGRPAAHGHGGRASGILSIPAKQVSRGAHRVGTIHVQAPTPHAPPLQAFLAEICWKRRRMRCRRLHVSSTDPRRPPGDLFGRD